MIFLKPYKSQNLFGASFLQALCRVLLLLSIFSFFFLLSSSFSTSSPSHGLLLLSHFLLSFFPLFFFCFLSHLLFFFCFFLLFSEGGDQNFQKIDDISPIFWQFSRCFSCARVLQYPFIHNILMHSRYIIDNSDILPIFPSIDFRSRTSFQDLSIHNISLIYPTFSSYIYR